MQKSWTPLPYGYYVQLLIAHYRGGTRRYPPRDYITIATPMQMLVEPWLNGSIRHLTLHMHPMYTLHNTNEYLKATNRKSKQLHLVPESRERWKPAPA